MGNTALDSLFSLEPSVPVVASSTNRTRNMAYYCVPLSGVTEPFIFCTTEEQISAYTDDIRPFIALKYLAGIYLAGDGLITDFSDLNKLCYTMLMAPNTNTITTDFSSFIGIKSYIEDNPNALIEPTVTNIPEQLAKTFATNVFYAHENSDANCEIFAEFLSPTLNPNLNNNQLKTYPRQSTILLNNSEVSIARSKQFSFLYSDGSTVITPSLYYFRAGGYTIADYYIVEELREGIQRLMYSYIGNNQPRYLNSQIAAMISKGYELINQYIASSKIESAVFTIPSKQDQSSTDIIDGLLNNCTLDITVAGAIWYGNGIVTYNIGGQA